MFSWFAFSLSLSLSSLPSIPPPSYSSLSGPFSAAVLERYDFSRIRFLTSLPLTWHALRSTGPWLQVPCPHSGLSLSQSALLQPDHLSSSLPTSPPGCLTAPPSSTCPDLPLMLLILPTSENCIHSVNVQWHLLAAQSCPPCEGDSREQNRSPALLAFTIHLPRCPMIKDSLQLPSSLPYTCNWTLSLLHSTVIISLPWSPSFQAILAAMIRATASG